MTIATNINRTGYLVIHTRDDGSKRTYACADHASLSTLIFYITGRTIGTFLIHHISGLPVVPRVLIASNLHIWGISLGQPALVEGKQNATIPLTRGDE